MVYFSCQLGFLLYHLATTEKKGTKKESMMEGEWGLIEVFTICFWGSMCIEYAPESSKGLEICAPQAPKTDLEAEI